MLLAQSSFLSYSTPNTITIDKIEVSCHIPPRSLTLSWPNYSDLTIFGGKYEGMKEIACLEDGDCALFSEVISLYHQLFILLIQLYFRLFNLQK